MRPTTVLIRLSVIGSVLGAGLLSAGIVLAATPIADDKTVQTDQGVAKTITLTATADSGAVDPPAYTIASGPSHDDGSLANATGSMTCDSNTPASCSADVLYTPVAGQWLDSFTYTVADATDGTSLPATVSITVDAAPVAADDPDSSCTSGTTGSPKKYIVIEDAPLTVDPSVDCGLLLNDTDADSGDTLTATKLANPGHGTVSVTSTGGFTYTPSSNYFGLDSFTYTVSDGLLTDSGTVLLTVLAVDDPPSAANDIGVTVPEDAPATAINVLANDTYLPDGPEILTIVAVTQGAHGTVAITGGGTGLTYKPDLSYIGTDTFTYTIQDSGGLPQDAATVALTVAKDTKAPITSAPSASIRTGVQMQSTYLLGHVGWTGSDAGVGIKTFQLQRSINGGAYASITLSTAKATSASLRFTFGTSYRFRLRAVDLNGNTSAWKYGPTFKPYRYQESSSTVVYTGSWAKALNSSDSGGATRYTSIATRTATFTTSGRDFAYVAPISSTRGSAQVYVDGVLSATVNLHSSTTIYRRVLWATHFSSLGTHAIRIVVLGTGRVDVDCFMVLR